MCLFARTGIALFGIHSERQLEAELSRQHGVLEPGAIVRFGPDTIWPPPPSTCGRPSSPAQPAAYRSNRTMLPVWMWSGTEEQLLQHAGDVLRRFLIPLCSSGQSYCVAVPVERARLAPAGLTPDRLDELDREDLGAVLDWRQHAGPGPAGSRHGAAPGVRLEPGAGLQGLDPPQAAAAAHVGGPARVLAPAGAGKTKTMIAHVALLVAEGVDPSAILVLAFNTEAAVQLEERLAVLGIPSTRRIPRLAGRGEKEGATSRAPDAGVHCATFNAFGFRYQRDVIGSVPSVSADGALHERVLRQALRGADSRIELGAAPAPCAPAPAEAGHNGQCGAPDPFDSGLADSAWRLDRLLATLRSDLAAPPVKARALVAAYEREQEALGIQAFDDQIQVTVTHMLAVPAARRHVQAVYRQVLVDEFQDVNEAQLALLDVLSRPWRNLYVVGDDDQLIYGWRFARPRSIVEYGEHRPRLHQPASYVLGTNYRGSQEIVRRADRLIRHNSLRVEKDVRARPGAPPGSCSLLAAKDWPARAAGVAAFLGAERVRLGCGWADLAVLCRYRAQLDLMAAHLESVGIPAAAPPGQGLFRSPVATRLCERLQHLLNGEAGESGMSLSPPERSLVRWLHQERPTAVEALDEAVAVLGLAENGSLQAGDAGGVHEVLDAARLLAWDQPDLPAFLAHWRRLSTTPAAAGDGRDRVVMATIHATKGREYHSVAIVDFAPATAKMTSEEVEEERRVLYVAITRARDSALLTIDLSRPPHHFMLELCDPERPSLRQLRAEERALERRFAQAGLDGWPWQTPSPAWLSRLPQLTAAQASLIADAFRVHGLCTEHQMRGGGWSRLLAVASGWLAGGKTQRTSRRAECERSR